MCFYKLLCQVLIYIVKYKKSKQNYSPPLKIKDKIKKSVTSNWTLKTVMYFILKVTMDIMNSLVMISLTFRDSVNFIVTFYKHLIYNDLSKKKSKLLKAYSQLMK